MNQKIPITTVSEIREQLRWPDVREDHLAEHAMRIIRAIPSNPDLPSVDLGFDEDMSYLEYQGFGCWHWHPSSIEEAVGEARKIIHRERCLLEVWSDQDQLCQSVPVPCDGIPDKLSLNAHYFVRSFFGEKGVREAIDFHRYYKGSHGYVEFGHKAEMEKLFQAAKRNPDW